MSRVVFSLFALAALAGCAPSQEQVAALIQRRSQEFSDASASGDAKVLANLLDDRVVFMNEGGDMPSKQDIVDGAQPPPAGVKNTLVQQDFKVQLHGDVAVTSFADVSTFQFHGQTLHARYLSTEVWRRESAGWKGGVGQLPEKPVVRPLAPLISTRL